MTTAFNCELTLVGVEAHHSSKNVAQLNHLTFIHFMYIEFYNSSLPQLCLKLYPQYLSFAYEI